MEMRASRFSQIGLAILLMTPLFGQLFRLDIFSGTAGGLLISDVLVVGASLVYLVWLLATGSWKNLPKYFKWLWLWMAVVIISYAINTVHYTGRQDLVAGAYLIRLLAYVGLVPLAYTFAHSMRSVMPRYLVYMTGGLLALGLVVSIVLPDFSVLVSQGWDPHQGRFTSTWLDPNFFGTFLGCMFAFFLSLTASLKKREGWKYWGGIGLLALIWLGIYFTFSRSALVTLAVASLFVAYFISWRTVAAVVVMLIFTVSVPSRFQSRVRETVSFSVQQAQGTDAGGVADPTGNARIISWKRAVALFEDQPVLGTGYNFYQYRQLQKGAFSEGQIENNRSTAGSDSSILNLLATTGVIGLLAFLAGWAGIVRVLWRGRRTAVCLSALGVLVGWFVSSFFNNTFLYAHMMLPFLLIIGVALREAESGKEDDDL